MKRYYRTLVFSNSILKTSFRFEDKFQILPIDMEGKPQSPYAHHFPMFLEYTIDYQNNEPTDIFTLGSIRHNTEKEILNLLSCLTNHRFFQYDTSMIGWGVKMPDKLVEDMTEQERQSIANQESSMFMGVYYYTGLKEDLKIEQFTDFKPTASFEEAQMHEYFIDNPIDDNRHEVRFPNTLYTALLNYYNLSSETRKMVNSSIYLACDGMDISVNKRSLSFLSYISAIEGLVELEVDDNEITFACGSCKAVESSPYLCPQCGRPIWGIKQKFVNFLVKFVAGSEDSQKKYGKIYNLRSKITHSGKLFLGDYELSFDENNEEKEYNEWLMRIETLQLFRISLDSWLRYTEKKKK